ncbi:MAG: hypothetical protein HETSPECPRED_003784 [Heterodermia speciosa]|uniref:Uncharacterized protein n=1 Tax=Heterodermia speciosa TaxID=116794 RepID=A0A8H3IF62_9LECA|nr:MAG: hypothetical protein HETSPECPRED_003784 [Heterodermia speciosa]
MARKYPEAEVRGIDLVAIQPDISLPRNVRFNAPRDYEGIWSLGENSWDLIHLRLGCGSVGDWPELYRNVLAHLKPGVGHFERVEVDFEPRCDDGTIDRMQCKLVQWYGDLKNATEKANRSIRYRGMESTEMLVRQGFVDVKEETIKLPINGWCRDEHLKSLGTDYTAWMGYDDLVGMSLQPFTHIEGMSPENARASAREAALDILRVKLHAYNVM